MTICIAAICGQNPTGPSRIVFCFDWRISGALGSAETKLKFRHIAKGPWRLMMAGTEEHMNALNRLVFEGFRNLERSEQQLDESSVPQMMREVLRRRKHILADEYISGHYGISYDEFLDHGKDRFPAEVHREAVVMIKNIKFGAALIVAGFTSLGFPMLLRTTDDGDVGTPDEFASIGEGSYLAQSVMLHRAHSDTHDLARAMYTVWEAKKYAEGVGSVGKFTSLITLEKDGSSTSISDIGRAELDSHYQRYGPKPTNGLVVEDITKLFDRNNG